MMESGLYCVFKGFARPAKPVVVAGPVPAMALCIERPGGAPWEKVLLAPSGTRVFNNREDAAAFARARRLRRRGITVRSLHRKASEGISTERLPRKVIAKAAGFEWAAARMLESGIGSEPTRGILYVSAASMLKLAGLDRLAAKCASEGLRTPDSVPDRQRKFLEAVVDDGKRAA